MLKHRFSGRIGLFADFKNFLSFFTAYLNKKLFKYVNYFENTKRILVKFFTIKRGRYNRLFLHLSTIVVLTAGVIVTPFIASTFPVFSKTTDSRLAIAEVQQPVAIDENVFQTSVSQKPRDKVITYDVQKGDTISTIAKKFAISEDTVRWANDLEGDNLAIGDTLQILPVTGMLHKVESGDTVYSIAKKYDTNPQGIVDFPFNDFANPETFSLVVGQLVVVPDGIKPESGAVPIYRQVYIAQSPSQVSSAGLAWPMSGGISQFFSWYHPAIDITNPIGTPIVAAQTGVVSAVSVGSWDGGYGTSVRIDDGNGLATHYSHMSGVNVSAGQAVVAGKTVIGWVGLTGRTTGPHLDLEVYKNGVRVNPMNLLQ